MSFITGNIVSIYLKNFLTYDEITIHPKPHLNVVIGPNGTGKSSFLCAIILGLGGNPDVTGRGKQVLEYIKHGKEEATIVIELFHTEGFINIKRCFSHNISKQNANSKWFIQDLPVTLTKVKEVVQNLGIMVNNLCQFLPQDRVVEFAKLNKVELLQSTERAIGEIELADQHELLFQNGKQLIELERKLDELNKNLQNEVSKNDKVEDKVRNIQNKEALENSIKNFKKAILFKKYNSSHKYYKELKDELEEVKKKCKELERAIEPSKNAENKLLQNIEKHDSFFKNQANMIRQQERQESTLKTECATEEDMILIAQEDFKTSQEDNKRRQNEISDFKRQIDVLNGQIAELQNIDETALSNKIRDLTEQIHAKSMEYTSLKNEQNGMENQFGNVNEYLKSLHMRLSKMKDVRLQRLGLLIGSQSRGKMQQKFKQIYDATLWLDKNRHLFKSNVYDPLYTMIDVRDQKFAVYIENTVPKQDLIAFVCEDVDDVNTLKAHADKNKWSVNVLHSLPIDTEKFQPIISRDVIRKLGFNCYMKDIIHAPPAIISYLCKNSHIHTIPLSLSERLPVELDQLPAELSLYFVGKTRYGSKRSKYDNKVTTLTSVLNGINLLSISDNNSDAKLQMEEQIRTESKRQESLTITLQDCKRKLELSNMELETLRSEKKEAQTILNQRKQLECNRASKIDAIRRKELDIIDVGVMEKKMQAQIVKSIDNMLKLTKKLNEVERSLAITCQNSIQKSFYLKKMQRELVLLRLKTSEDKEQLIDIKKEAAMKENTCQEALEKAKGFIRELFRLLGLGMNAKITQEIKVDLLSLSNDELDVLERKLAEAEVSRDCLVSADDEILKEYNTRLVKITKLKEEKQKATLVIDRERDKIAECQRNWLPKITLLISKINEHFSTYMSRLGCAGEVQLEKGDNENDFSKYGIAIRVKFRDTEKLNALTAHQQSGGEKSVCTALYLLALQTLTAVPFRCVDEINQGMDAANERNMFTMLVENTTTETASQYFLVTPKLLPDLPFNDRVNFMTVYNGPNLHQPKYFKIKKQLKNLKRKQEN